MVSARAPRSRVQRPFRGAEGRIRPAHDHERRRLPRPVVRDRSRSRRRCAPRESSAPSRGSAHRAPRTSFCTTTWARSTASCGRGGYRGEERGPSARRSRTQRGRSAPRSGPRPPSQRILTRGGEVIGAVTSSGEEVVGRVAVEPRPAPNVHPSRPARPPRPVLPGGDRALPVPGLQREGEPRPGRASGVHVPARRRRTPARGDQLQSEHRLHGAGLRRREGRAVQPAPLHRHDHPDPGRSVDGAARASTS